MTRTGVTWKRCRDRCTPGGCPTRGPRVPKRLKRSWPTRSPRVSATARLRASHVLALGVTSMVVGLGLLVTAVRLSTPSLALFLVGGALIGAGSGLVFKGTTAIVLEAAAPEDRVAMTSTLIIAVFVGLSIPVIGAGVALSKGASAPGTVLGFAVAVGAGVALSGWALLGRRPRGS